MRVLRTAQSASVRSRLTLTGYLTLYFTAIVLLLMPCFMLKIAPGIGIIHIGFGALAGTLVITGALAAIYNSGSGSWGPSWPLSVAFGTLTLAVLATVITGLDLFVDEQFLGFAHTDAHHIFAAATAALTRG